jgi:hypothetical protein
MIVLDWPSASFKIASEDWYLSGRTISSGGIFGAGTVIHVENRVWRVTVDLGPLYATEGQALRATFDELRGQYGVVRVPVRQASPQAGALAAVGFDSGVTFDSDVEFSAETLTGITVAESAAAGATLIRLSANPSLMRPGAMFSLPGDRLHRVHSAVGAWIKINPPLRSALNAGDAVEFATPMARMRLTQDDAALQRLANGLTAPRTFDLVEAF